MLNCKFSNTIQIHLVFLIIICCSSYFVPFTCLQMVSGGNREETQASAPSTDERTSPSLPAAGTLDYSRANDLYLDFQQLEDLQPQEKKELSDISSAEPEAKDALKSETSKANDDPVYHVLSRENLA